MFFRDTDYSVFDDSFVNLRKCIQCTHRFKFDISFLLELPLSSGISDAVLALSGKTFCAILVLMTLVSNGVKNLTESFTSLGGMISMSLFNFTFIYRFGGKSFTIRNIGSIDYLFDFNNAWMIFVRLTISLADCTLVFSKFVPKVFGLVPLLFPSVFM